MLDGIIRNLGLPLLHRICCLEIMFTRFENFHQTHEITYKLQMGLIAPNASFTMANKLF